MSDENVDSDVIGAALEAGIMISTQYGQGIHKTMPVSDRATLVHFAQMVREKLAQENRELRRTIDSLTQTLATERDQFGKREIELMQENRELREALEKIIKHCEITAGEGFIKYSTTWKIAKAALAKSGDRHE